MIRKSTLKTAIWALEQQLKKTEFDSNLYSIYGVRNPHSKRQFKLNKKIKTAIGELEALCTSL